MTWLDAASVSLILTPARNTSMPARAAITSIAFTASTIAALMLRFSSTCSYDVESSKPEPDIVQAALDKAELDADRAIFVGDTVWDVEAARRAGLDCVAVLSGGISEHELRESGAVAVYRDVAALLDGFDVSPLGALARRSAG